MPQIGRFVYSVYLNVEKDSDAKLLDIFRTDDFILMYILFLNILFFTLYSAFDMMARDSVSSVVSLRSHFSANFPYLAF